MTPMDKCPQCPVKGECFAARFHRPFCRYIAAKAPGRAEQVMALSGEAPPPPPASPGLLAMAGSLARATVAHVADGMRHATLDEQDRRKAICVACPLHDAARDACRACGCNLPLKRSWLSSTCPEGRWEAGAT